MTACASAGSGFRSHISMITPNSDGAVFRVSTDSLYYFCISSASINPLKVIRKPEGRFSILYIIVSSENSCRAATDGSGNGPIGYDWRAEVPDAPGFGLAGARPSSAHFHHFGRRTRRHVWLPRKSPLSGEEQPIVARSRCLTPRPLTQQKAADPAEPTNLAGLRYESNAKKAARFSSSCCASRTGMGDSFENH
jgi:hypothetical protein